MKNLTVNMPLAVPHQRPPSKYASHPYPILLKEVMSVSASILGDGYELPATTDLMSIASIISGDGAMKSLLSDFSIDVEDLIISTTMNGVGELISERELNREYDMGIDNLEVSCAISGNGDMKRILIAHKLTVDELAYTTKINGMGVMV